MNIEALRAKNPNLPFYTVFDPEFREYGRVIPFAGEAFEKACEEACEMPQSRTMYNPDIPELEQNGLLEAACHELRGDGSCQVGCCWGYNSLLNCLEYHRASEHNIAVSDLVLLLAKQTEMEGNDLPACKVKAFFVPKGTTVEVYATTLHFAPCQVSDTGFRCIVILPRGTNHPLEKPRPETGDGRLLWAKDKWLIANPENTVTVQKGAYPGLHGENFKVKY